MTALVLVAAKSLVMLSHTVVGLVVCLYFVYMSHTGVPKLTPSKRGRILALCEEGDTYKEIAKKTRGVAPSTCQKMVKHNEKHSA